VFWQKAFIFSDSQISWTTMCSAILFSIEFYLYGLKSYANAVATMCFLFFKTPRS
jgi:hypothetical protein